MKKSITIILIFLSAFIFGIAMVNKQNSMENDIDLIIYEEKQSDEIVKPKVILSKENQFEFFYAVENSYKANGKYEIKKEKLYLETDDKKYIFVFSMKDRSLIFEFQESVLPSNFVHVNDKAVFDLVDEN